MISLLAIAGPPDLDAELVAGIAQRTPRRVLIALPDAPEDWASSDSAEARATRERLASLMTAAELATGADVAGTVGPPWSFDALDFDAAIEPGVLAAAA